MSETARQVGKKSCRQHARFGHRGKFIANTSRGTQQVTLSAPAPTQEDENFGPWKGKAVCVRAWGWHTRAHHGLVLIVLIEGLGRALKHAADSHTRVTSAERGPGRADVEVPAELHELHTQRLETFQAGGVQQQR